MAEASDTPGTTHASLMSESCPDGRDAGDETDTMADMLTHMDLNTGDVFCDAVDEVSSAQSFAVASPSGGNSLVPSFNPGDWQPTLLCNISEVTIDSERSHFVYTEDMGDAVDALETHGRVVLCGPPGSGKTTLGHALLRHYRQDGFAPYVMAHLQDWHVHIGDGRRSVVLMDGTLGEICVDESEYRRWRSITRSILQLNKIKECLLVLILYPHVLRELRVLDAGTDSPLMESMVVVRVMRHPLDEDTKTAMLTTHLKQLHLPTAQQDALVADILQKDKEHVSGAAFPWCCRQLVTRLTAAFDPDDTDEASDELDPVFKRACDPADIFTAPCESYLSLLQRMISHKEYGETLAVVMALAMLGLGRFLYDPGSVKSRLETLGIRPLSDYRLDKYADALKGSILSDDGLGFYSRVIYDAVGLILGRSFSLPVLLRVCDVIFFVQRVLPEATGREFSVTIGPSPADRQHFMQAMYEHVVNGKLPELCQHPALHCQQFLAEFEAFCRDNKNYLQRVLRAVDTVHNMPLLYWSAWSPSGNLTRWCLQLTESEAAHNVEAGSLAPVLFACAMLGKTADWEHSARRTVLGKLARAVNDWNKPTGIDLPMPSPHQCIIEDLQAMKSQLMTIIQEGLCYLGDRSLPISQELVHAELRPPGNSDTVHAGLRPPGDSDKVHVVVASRLWYLALRLVWDIVVDEEDDEGNTVLHTAARTGNMEAISMAVRSGAALTATNNAGLTPTQLAANRTREGKKVESRQLAVNELRQACRVGDIDRVKDLLCISARGHDRDNEGRSHQHAATLHHTAPHCTTLHHTAPH